MRAVAFALLVCVILLALLPAVFVLARADHGHDHDGAGGGCAVCAQIHDAENLLKPSGAVAGVIFRGLVCLFIAAGIFISPAAGAGTPVALKIRFNN